MLIRICDELWVDPEVVVAVRKTGEGMCAVFVYGQPTTDGGFPVEYEVDDAARHVNDALMEAAEDGGTGDEDDGEEEEGQ